MPYWNNNQGVPKSLVSNAYKWYFFKGVNPEDRDGGYAIISVNPEDRDGGYAIISEVVVSEYVYCIHQVTYLTPSF